MPRRVKRTVEENAKVVSDAFAQIVRFSLNESFRNQCFDALQVEGSFDLQKECNEKLLKSVRPPVYLGTQSSRYSSQHSKTAGPSQSSQASSLVYNIENTLLSTNLAKKDEVHVDILAKSSQPAAFHNSSFDRRSQYNETSLSSTISVNNSASTSHSLPANSIPQINEHLYLSSMNQEEKDLVEWGEDSEEDQVMD